MKVKSDLGDNWVYDSAEIKAERLRLIEEQGGIDPITGFKLIRPCLDHDHFEGRVRGVLSSKINLFEGQILRYWQKHTQDHPEWNLTTALRNMADYLEKDVSHMKLHGNYLEDMKKFLWRCTTETIVRRAKEDFNVDLITDSVDKANLIGQYILLLAKQAEENDW